MSGAAERMEHLTSLLQQVMALASAGRSAEALALVPDLLAAADDTVLVTASPEQAKGLIDVAARLIGVGPPDPLEQLVVKGLHVLQQHPAAGAADLFVGLYTLCVLYDRKGDNGACTRAASAIVNLAGRIDEPVHSAAMQVLLRVAEMYESAGQHKATVILYRLLDRSLEAIPDVPPDTRARWLQRYGHALLLGGEPEAAVAAYRSGLARLGEGDEAVDERIGLLGAMAGAAQRGGDGQIAEQAFQASLALIERFGKQETPLAAAVYHNLAVMYVGQHRPERYAEAEQLARQSVEIERRLGDRPTPGHAASIALVAQLVAMRGAADEANRLYEEAIRTLDAAAETKPGDLADYLTDWGLQLLDAGRAREAVAPLERTLRIRESMPEKPDLASTLSNLAAAQFEAGALHEAVLLFRRALDLRHRSPPAWTGSGEWARNAERAERLVRVHLRDQGEASLIGDSSTLKI